MIARRLKTWFASLPSQALQGRDWFDLCAAMTLLLLLFYSIDAWYVQAPVRALAVLAFAFQSVRKKPLFWLIIALLILTGTFRHWFEADNHKYLMGYWCLALSLSLWSREPEEVLRITARRLIGLGFLFAVIWKVISVDYLDGSFFQYAILTDSRFSAIAEGPGGLTGREMEMNSAAYDSLLDYKSRLEEVDLVSTPAIAGVAIFLTWWTLLIEVLIAVAFLLPERIRIQAGRDISLLIFILSTYTLASVTGFGWLLAIMGMVQSVNSFRYARLAYLIAIILLQVYRLPWDRFFDFIGM